MQHNKSTPLSIRKVYERVTESFCSLLSVHQPTLNRNMEYFLTYISFFSVVSLRSMFPRCVTVDEEV